MVKSLRTTSKELPREVTVAESSGRASRRLDSSWPQPSAAYLLDQLNVPYTPILSVCELLTTHVGNFVCNSVVCRLLFHYSPSAWHSTCMFRSPENVFLSFGRTLEEPFGGSGSPGSQWACSGTASTTKQCLKAVPAGARKTAAEAQRKPKGAIYLKLSPQFRRFFETMG